MANESLAGVLRHIRQLVEKPALERLSDEELLERFIAGSEPAVFEAMLRRHGPLVYRVCRRVLRDLHDAEDAFQATFLILLRQAAKIRKRGSLACWLHGVAYRTAVKARSEAALRAAKERQSAARHPESLSPETSWREVRAVLDEELHQLPEKYRAPFVLCYLEGRTNEQAAAELGVPLGSLSKRLARARGLLRTRLSRRGVTLSAGFLILLLTERTASALPAGLVASTARIGRLTIAGTPTAGLVSPSVVALVEGGLKATVVGKLKAAVGVLAATLFLASAGTLTHVVPMRTDKPAQEPAAQPTAETPERPGLPSRQQTLVARDFGTSWRHRLVAGVRSRRPNLGLGRRALGPDRRNHSLGSRQGQAARSHGGPDGGAIDCLRA